MHKIGKAALVLFMVLTMGLLTSSAAQASSFTFTADWNHTLESRHFQTGRSGTITVTLNKVNNCPTSTPARVTVELWYEDFPGDTQYGGSKTINCSTGGSVSWTGAPQDTYYFKLKGPGPGLTPNRTTTGSTSYP